jgi:hypothetical protein
VAIAPPALGIEEELVAGVWRDWTLGTQSAPKPVSVEVLGSVGKEVFRKEALIDRQPAGVHERDFSPSEQPVAADEVVVDLAFLLSVVVAPEEGDSPRSVPGHGRASPNLIETQAAGLRTDAGMEDEFKPWLQWESYFERMLCFGIGPQERMSDGRGKREH